MQSQPEDPTLQERLAAAGGLSEGLAGEFSEGFGYGAADVFGVGTFFEHLTPERAPVGVCAGLSCSLVGGGERLAGARAAGLEAQACSCLAACDRTPAARVERELLAPLAPGQLEATDGDWRALAATPDTGGGHVWPSEAGDGDLVFALAGEPDRSGAALGRARELGHEGFLEQLTRSGLQGRGGAGFPAADKWRSVAGQADDLRYLVLNADEGEPGTFKDRELLVRRPDLVLEGLMIAAWALGVKEIHAYLRAEFGEPRRALEAELAAARADGRLGPELSFRLHEGQGAYICGEETALLEAIEGRRGQPRQKPPYPTEVGLWGKPTLVHNVETIAAVPSIAKRGGAWFAGLGREGPGTKLYSLSGHVARPGVYELPLGATLNELLEAAGGCTGELKAFTPGGASSGFLPASKADLPLGFRSLAAEGTMLGSAGVVVLDSSVDMARAAQIQLAFFEAESCGQCTPCRLGTRFLNQALSRHLAGEEGGRPLAEVAEVAWEMNEASICGLGQAAPLPLSSAVKWWPAEFAGGDSGGRGAGPAGLARGSGDGE